MLRHRRRACANGRWEAPRAPGGEWAFMIRQGEPRLPNRVPMVPYGREAVFLFSSFRPHSHCQHACSSPRLSVTCPQLAPSNNRRVCGEATAWLAHAPFPPPCQWGPRRFRPLPAMAVQGARADGTEVSAQVTPSFVTPPEALPAVSPPPQLQRRILSQADERGDPISRLAAPC